MFTQVRYGVLALIGTMFIMGAGTKVLHAVFGGVGGEASMTIVLVGLLYGGVELVRSSVDIRRHVSVATVVALRMVPLVGIVLAATEYITYAEYLLALQASIGTLLFFSIYVHAGFLLTQAEEMDPDFKKSRIED